MMLTVPALSVALNHPAGKLTGACCRLVLPRHWRSAQHSSTPKPRSKLLVAQAAPAQQPQPGVPSKAVQDKVAALLQEAQDLQYDEKLAEAAALLRQGLQQLEAGPEPAQLPALLVRQCLSEVLFSLGDYAAAAAEAQAVYEGIVGVVGGEAEEAIPFSIRAAIYQAASGDVEAGAQRIFDAGSQALPSLQSAIQQAYDMQAEDAPAAALAEQDRFVRKLMACLGESAYYYSLFTVQQLVSGGEEEDLLANWEQLGGNMARGLTDMAEISGADTPAVRCALREHARLLGALQPAKPEVKKLLEEQAAQLGKLVEDTSEWQKA